ncbi:serine protease inhibitor ecotin [Phenylobacterium sp. SCN 70-31]|uniref:serine protease inhibitor ecotin n=1 Tax=Phenylobacterium sp. SCN 70-31 TaxID=1660129 RepID=UPI0008694E91|nr:serine protease inhibitor ecotin [Phenylobacterium sp. SCN 70-31]ODT85168.1 MAG: ecotin [Phenylobacterium sp. SCN 70-31]
MKTSSALTVGASGFALAAFIAVPVCANPAPKPAPKPAAGSSASADLRPYPAAAKGQKRTVIQLPALADAEADMKVEIIVGKTMRVDCNIRFFGGRVAERTVQGWGYTYYVLKDLGQAASTLKGCPPGSEHDAFVRSSDETLIRYNSRLPVVVYTPADVEVRYRIWRAGEPQSVD